MQLTKDWDKTFPQSEQVHHQKVSFTNRYGIILAADMYWPKAHRDAALPAIAVSGPFGAVKEQASGLYAQAMAERGFVTLAFDPSYTGESGGTPRNIASPEINTEDFSAAVDFLGSQTMVDRQRISLIGVCGFGGMALNAAAVDTRIKAVVTASMYDMSRVMSKGYNDSTTGEQRRQTLEALNQQRWADAEHGVPAEGARNLPESKDGVDNPVVSMYFDYYRTPRGFHGRSLNSSGAWSMTMPLPFMNMPLLTYIGEIAPRRVLLIAGEHAHSRYFSEDAARAAGAAAELMIIAGANHTDLYDSTIPFARIAEFLAEAGR